MRVTCALTVGSLRYNSAAAFDAGEVDAADR
jgi:hypothetical protein